MRLLACLIVAPQRGYDEPATLSYAISSFCPTSADGLHCRDDDDLAKAVRHMEKLQVRRLPVINKSRRMIGILSLGDISNSAPGDLLSECVRSVSAHH